MSHENDTEKSLQTLGELIQIREKNCLLTMGIPDSEDVNAAVLQAFSPLPILPNRSETDDDTVSTSEAVDPRNRDVHVKLPSPRLEKADPNSLGLPASTLGRSHTNASRSATPDSSVASDTIDFDILDSVWERSRSATPESSDRPREAADAINFELPRSTCGRSHSGESRSDSPASSVVYSWLEEPNNLFLRYYERIMYLIKRKGYILPFEVICLALAIASCYMGAYYWPMCPADEYVPKYVFFNGAIATFSLCVKIMGNLWRILLQFSYSIRRYFCSFTIGWIAIITTLVEMLEFYTMSYSFHRNDENYCNETFYWFVFYKNIALGVLMSLLAWIYLPSIGNYYLEEFDMYG